MSDLERKVFHDCQKPIPPDPDAFYRWTCPYCDSRWHWLRGLALMPRTVHVRYGFLWLRTREEKRLARGCWMADERTFTWEPS